MRISDWSSDVCSSDLSTSLRQLKNDYSVQLQNRIVKEQIHSPWIRENIHANTFLNRGGASRDRTDDPMLAKQVLSQLSYGPGDPIYPSKWWVWLDLNQRPHAYQACALTS